MIIATTPKGKLFETAARLFYRHGYRATGVDTIAAESGIGKMTLYRHYPSKDDLIIAFLHQSDEDFWGYFERSIGKAKTDREKLLAFFEALQVYVTSPECFGCPFINVATEFPEADHPGHQVALKHKESVRLRFRQLIEGTGASHPEVLADALVLLMDGAYLSARMFGPTIGNPAGNVAEVARDLIGAACKEN